MSTADSDTNRLGWTALWLAIGGIVVPYLLTVLGFAEADLSYIVFAALEFAALVCGLLSLRTRPGIAATAIGGVSMLGCVWIFLLTPLGDDSKPVGQPVEVEVSPESTQR